jgi:phosphoribosylamine-glycine ligase
MNVLLVGSGGREHALAWKIAQSPMLTRLVTAPGNPGIETVCECRPVGVTDVAALVALAQEIRADLVVVGPESALEAGLADRLTKLGIPCFGPTKAAAQLETSKAFSKAFAERHALPTAPHFTCETVEAGRAALDRFQPPYVIKADGLAAEGAPYRGVLFAGLMIDGGEPSLVEFNARFGDPECQVLMLRLSSDLLPYLHAAATGTLSKLPPPVWREEVAICVVLAARGYPDAPEKGSVIRGADQDFGEDVTVFHAGTARRADGALIASGGRVLNVCARGETLGIARGRAYAAIARIDWPEGFHRTDIGWRALS